MKVDIAIIGSGPGGYVAAIRARQLGFSVAIIEKSELGGVCLNWGCIPTKALLKSAEVYKYIVNAQNYGINIEGNVRPDFAKIIERSRGIAAQMSKGVQFLLNKNGVTIVQGHGRIAAKGRVEVTGSDGGNGSLSDGSKTEIEASHIIIATGARPAELPFLKIDSKRIISSRDALILEKQPQSMVIVGSGAIGCEFAGFFSAIGTKVTIVECLPNLLPAGDEEVSKHIERAFRKARISVMTSTAVKSVDITNAGCRVNVESKKGIETIDAEIVFSAIGVRSNIENIGLEEMGIEVEKGKIKVNEWYETSVKGIYAVGDIVPEPALAHVASASAICCIEKIAGLEPKPIDYSNTPSCVYTSPEVASVGMTEREAVEKGFAVKIGKFPYTASGKATAAGERDGFVKLVVDAATDSVLGAHFVGMNVTEMIAEPTMVKALGGKAADILKTIHPHPTMSEAIMEAAANAHNEAIHI